MRHSLEFLLMLGEEEISITIEHNFKNRLTRIIAESSKNIETVRGRKLEEAFPITFIHTKRNWKIRADFDNKSKTFLLYINDREFGKLPYQKTIVGDEDE